MKILFIGARLFDDVAFYLEEKGIESIVTESNPNSPNLELADKSYIVPRGMQKPIEIAIKEKVDGVISLIGIDDPLMDVAIAKEKLEAEHGIPLIASNTQAIAISCDKLRTKEFFKEIGVETSKFMIANSSKDIIDSNLFSSNPVDCNLLDSNLVDSNLVDHDSVDHDSVDHDSVDYDSVDSNLVDSDSVFVLKQRAGQGGRDISIVTNLEEMDEYFFNFDSAICEEFIEGSEISIEVLCFNNEYLPLVPVYKGETTLEGTHPLNKTRSSPCEINGLNIENVRKVAYKIAKALKGEGTIDIDFIFSKKDKKLYALEINTRPSGTRYLTAAASGIHPLTKLVDMVTGEFNVNSVENKMNSYFALELPIGNYKGPNNSEPLKKFTKNSWVCHGPLNYERITISGETKEKIEEISNEILGNDFNKNRQG
ncbi:carbamoyl-phosphate synthase large chain [Methanobrevibacter cuticularis]|uniref:Carbamoyl-phosphate synthase n=1 Tax=Methanobrevibacter cuticularis TaxID=47311 RepID=A0A166E3G0_9EURY|nr:ATP-grasp domain-containing protein [Methanobrevibacter cuticularis]KZX16239.1 carbamoyl-phosphate synthase large chain [Methanobrevibacter cuticularis]